MADLSGRRAVVIDGATALGAGIAAGLREAGASLYIAGTERLHAPSAEHVDDRGLRALLEGLGDEQGRLDVLASCRSLRLSDGWGAFAAARIARGGLIIDVSLASGVIDRVDVALAVRQMALELASRGIAALALEPAASAHFTGRCCAALAMDPDIMEKSGGLCSVAELAAEYRFTDPREVPPRP